MTEDLILSFDTATNHCSVALTRGALHDGVVVASVNIASDITHSRRLLGSIEWLMQQVDATVADLAAIAVGLGPGSFTGLRIGMATAKGLCHGSGKPLIGISSLDALGCAIESDRLICVVFDARKHEVYSCFYRRQPDGTVVVCSVPRVGPPQDLADSIDEPVILAGDGVAAYGSLWPELLGGRMQQAVARHCYPSAEMVGLLAGVKLRAGSFLELDSARPLYVRSSDAELSLVMPTRTIDALKKVQGTGA